MQVYGVAKREKMRVSCDVIANPSSNLKFQWVFNSSSERLDLQENLIEVRGTRSTAHHTPLTEMDYGSLMCWAENSIGRQSEPCIFHLIPAGKPDKVSNCVVVNRTASSLRVECAAGFDGGLPQKFLMEVRDAKSLFVVANTTNAARPVFTVTGLRPATGYVVSVRSFNVKGASADLQLQAFTGLEVEGANHKAESALTHPDSEPEKTGLAVTPILGILLVVGSALILVFLEITAYFCVFRRRGRAAASRVRRPRDLKGDVKTSHVPLQTGIDDCVVNEMKALNNLKQANNCNDPDLIPIQARSGKKKNISYAFMRLKEKERVRINLLESIADRPRLRHGKRFVSHSPLRKASQKCKWRQTELKSFSVSLSGGAKKNRRFSPPF